MRKSVTLPHEKNTTEQKKATNFTAAGNARFNY